MKYKRFFAAMLLMILLAGISALLPSLFLLVWQEQAEPLSWQRILVLISAVGGAKAVEIGLTVFRERYARGFNERNFRSMLEDSLAMDYDSIITMGPANILERISDSVNNIYFYMTGNYISIWASVITILACLGLIASIQPWLAALLLVMLPVNYFGYHMLNRELAKRSRELSEQTSQGFQEILSYVSQVDYIKQAADHTALFSALSPSIDKLYRPMARVNVYAQSVSKALMGLNDMVQKFILLAIVYGFAAELLGPYSLIMTSMILPLYFSNLASIVNAKLNQNGFRVAKEFQAKLRAHREPDGTKPLSEITQLQYTVETLSTQGQALPFHAAGTLQKGDIAQICGPSGCGKSTFAKALLKFRPVSGIAYNGIPISDIQNRQLRARVEYLSQNVPVIRGTLGDNLFLNTPRTEEAERRFLREPLLQSIFASKTLETEILENGANLSGGEKQKIALARALSSSAGVLILDEVCSNIDQEAADAIYGCLARERANRITILISHDKLPEGLVNVYIHPESA